MPWCRYRGAVAQRFNFGMPEPRRRDGWFTVGNIDVTTTAFLVGVGVISLFVYAVSPSAVANLVFFPEFVRQGEVWRLATWPFVSQPSIWVLISMFFFWFFGHIVEEMVGRIRYTRMVAAIVIAPTLFVSIVGDLATAPEAGLNLLGTVMLVIFAVENPNAPFFFGIPAWVIASVFVGLDVLGYAGNRWWGTLVVLLLAIGIALFSIRQWGFADRLDFIPRLGSGSKHSRPTRSRSGRIKRPTRKPAQRVVPGPWEPPAGAPSAETAAMQAELDRLLDKISSEGLDALSRSEKERLNELSKRLR